MIDKDIEGKEKTLEMMKRMREGNPRYISA